MHIRCTYQNVNAYLAMTEMCIDIIDGDVREIAFFHPSMYVHHSFSFVRSKNLLHLFLSLNASLEIRNETCVIATTPKSTSNHELFGNIDMKT